MAKKDLIKEARALGIVNPDKLTAKELKAAIKAARAEKKEVERVEAEKVVEETQPVRPAQPVSRPGESICGNCVFFKSGQKDCEKTGATFRRVRGCGSYKEI